MRPRRSLLFLVMFLVFSLSVAPQVGLADDWDDEPRSSDDDSGSGPVSDALNACFLWPFELMISTTEGTSASLGELSGATTQDFFSSGSTIQHTDQTMLLTTSVTTSVVLLVGIGFTVLVAMTAERAVTLERYLRHNAVALRGDIITGGGDTVDDLAALFAVPLEQREVFASMLRRRSSKLLPMLDNESLASGSAHDFIATVHDGMWSTPGLQETMFRRIVSVRIDWWGVPPASHLRPEDTGLQASLTPRRSPPREPGESIHPLTPH